MGHVDTPAAQSAHMLRCRHGSSTTALGRSRQTTHDGSSPSPTAGGGGSAGSLRAGSALHSPTPVTRAPNGEDTPFWGRSQARTERWRRFAARLRSFRRSFLRPRNHARACRWRRRAAADRASVTGSVGGRRRLSEVRSSTRERALRRSSAPSPGREGVRGGLGGVRAARVGTFDPCFSPLSNANPTLSRKWGR